MPTKSLSLLPPAPHLCQSCAVDHKPEQPHDATSFFYAFWFHGQTGRSPTWADAMAHCDEANKKFWTKYLTGVGIDINSTQLRGDIKTKEDLAERMAKVAEEILEPVEDS
jgi:hypothetical protein